ncbi:ubiquitin-related domain-containing protein [Amanita rubescens]|nr:ubiquitin-related domain-containing protein [Amanita rubescens]
MASDRDSLIAMGFDPASVDSALNATNNRGLQPAIDYLLQEHHSDQVSDVPAEDDQLLDLTAVEAKSIKCSECGKVFKNTALANFHAEKSGHDQFEESTEELKPLTEEEKAQKLVELRDKMAQKKAQKAVEEAKENQANETLRRKAGKDMNKIKEELKVKQAMQEAEAKKREKIEDARARAAVKAQIEADKKARAEKAAREKALREGQSIPMSGAPQTTPAAAAVAVQSGSSKEFKETRLQIRLASGGQPFTTYTAKRITAIAEYLAAQTLTIDVETVTFTQTFPRKTFTRADFSKSLKELGLTPSAVLLAS